MTYREFLETPLWRRTAARIRGRANNRCERCGSNHCRLTIHHDDYTAPNRSDAPWWVPEGWLPDDLFLKCVCGECHDFLHNRGPDPMEYPSLAELARIVQAWNPTI